MSDLRALLISDYHAGLGVASNKRVAQNQRQLGAPEGNVLVVAAHGPDALLQRQQRLVDLGALLPRLPVRTAGVRAPLAARQVDEREFAVQRVGGGTVTGNLG
jgi:hypothetical protein